MACTALGSSDDDSVEAVLDELRSELSTDVLSFCRCVVVLSVCCCSVGVVVLSVMSLLVVHVVSIAKDKLP